MATKLEDVIYLETSLSGCVSLEFIDNIGSDTIQRGKNDCINEKNIEKGEHFDHENESIWVKRNKYVHVNLIV